MVKKEHARIEYSRHGTGRIYIDSLFEEILERLDVKESYALTDFEIDLEDNSMFFSYAALGSPFPAVSFSNILSYFFL
jgi:hypothetical protein